MEGRIVNVSWNVTSYNMRKSKRIWRTRRRSMSKDTAVGLRFCVIEVIIWWIIQWRIISSDPVLFYAKTYFRAGWWKLYKFLKSFAHQCTETRSSVYIYLFEGHASQFCSMRFWASIYWVIPDPLAVHLFCCGHFVRRYPSLQQLRQSP